MSEQRATLNIGGTVYPDVEHDARLVVNGAALREAFLLERKDAESVASSLTRALGAGCECGHADCVYARTFLAGAIAFGAVLVGKTTVEPAAREPAVDLAALAGAVVREVGAVGAEIATLRGDVLAAVAAIVPTVTVNAAPLANVDVVRDADGRVTGIRGAGS